MSRINCQRFLVRGMVQGVGFRPFVYRLAHQLGLAGWVANTVHGVQIEAEGDSSALERFAARLRTEAPPMARVLSVRRKKSSRRGYRSFVIRPSTSRSGRTTLISPDAAVCDQCLEEMRDPSNRRFRYPFINCTNCGPRYTIILDIPYDRSRTTMSSFIMCDLCRAEFENPLDRRFHAQPNACPVCGPRAALVDRQGKDLALGQDPVEKAGRAILDGKVLAVKGLGGFHLAVDASCEDAAGALRQRKKRQDKPFAVMFPSLESLGRYCRLTREAAAALESPSRPIVVLPRRKLHDGLAQYVAPFQNTCGAMLPYTPLHYLLVEAVGGIPLVMTSGNSSDEPIEIDNREALQRLGHIVDCFLIHDRPIHMRSDDSVVIPMGRTLVPARRSRGWVPGPVILTQSLPPVLAVGGHLKNTVCVLRGNQAFLSQHVGDLDSPDTYNFFVRTVEHLCRLMEVTPDRVAHDLHPAYLSTRWAIRESGLPAVPVQHHHAHVVSLMAEHGLSGKVLGLAMDGTGYGSDGTIWGGEFLVADETSFVRAGHLPPAPMPGGEAAVREPWRMARSVFALALGAEALDSLGLKLWDQVGRKKVDLVDRMIQKGINCPLSSGCGRLFDAVAAVTGIRDLALYEGQPAVELESRAWSARRKKVPLYEFGLPAHRDSGRPLVPDLAPMLNGIAKDAARGKDPALIARAFHDCLCRVMADMAVSLARSGNISRVLLTGGVFNNRYLSQNLGAALRRSGLKVYIHRRVPPGDGGISLGQAVVAAHAKL